MMLYKVYKVSGALAFTAEISCKEDWPDGYKKRHALMWGMDREDTKYLNLEGIDLSGMFLDVPECMHNFYGCNFRSANLSNSYFTNFAFPFTDFTNANMRESNFDYCNFSYANLTNTNFRHSSLIFADLRDARVIGADFEGVSFLPTWTITGCIEELEDETKYDE